MTQNLAKNNSEAIAVTRNPDNTVNAGQVVIITPEATETAKRYWSVIKKGAGQRRKQWLFIGQYLLNIKAEYTANNQGKRMPNKDFGEARSKVFPDMAVDLAGYAMTYAENHEDVDKWAKQHAPELATPAHLVKRWRAWKGQTDKAPRIAGPTPATSGKADNPEPGRPSTEPETNLNFEDLARDGKVRINETAVKLNTGLSMLLVYLKQGHKLEIATLASLKNRLQAVLERLEVAQARADQQAE